MLLLCYFLQDARSILSAGSGDDGEYGADTKSQIDNDNNSHSSSNNHIPLQEDSSGISATISNGGFLCESHVAKVQETAAIVTKARRRQEEQHREDDTSADEDWTGHTTSIDAIMLSHRQRQARLPINQNSNERWIHDDELESGKTEFRQYRSDLMRLALCFHEKGAISKAFQIYQGELRRLFKDYAFPLVNIAHIHFRQGEPSKALNSLQLYFKEVEGTNVTDRDSLIFGTPCHSKALFLEDCISALNLLGLTYSSLYNHQGAMAAYNKALEIGENNNAILAIADIHENLGTLEYEMGKYESARAYFLRAFLARNVPRLKDADASKYLSTTDFTPFIQWALLVPPVPRSIEDAVGLSHAFSNSLDILEMLINQGGYRLEIHACERTSWQRTSNIEHEVEACLSIRPGQNDGTKQSSLQRVVLQYLKPQDIELLKSTIQGVPVRRSDQSL
jgi:tetratricopeptide (TPR) repeat protein